MLSFDLSYFDAGAKYSNNDHLLATISIHPKSQFPVDFMPCTCFHFVLKRCLLPIGLIGLCFTFCVSKGGIHARMSFLLLLLLFPITQDLFLLKFLARIGSWKPYLTFVCSYKWPVLVSLQADRSTGYPAIIATPVLPWMKKIIRVIWVLRMAPVNHMILLRTPATQMIFFNQGMLLLGSNHFLIDVYPR